MAPWVESMAPSRVMLLRVGPMPRTVKPSMPFSRLRAEETPGSKMASSLALMLGRLP
jgi:hypothetical protein